MRRKNDAIVEVFKEKSAAHKKIQAQYDSIKKRLLQADAREAAEETVESNLASQSNFAAMPMDHRRPGNARQHIGSPLTASDEWIDPWKSHAKQSSWPSAGTSQFRSRLPNLQFKQSTHFGNYDHVHAARRQDPRI